MRRRWLMSEMPDGWSVDVDGEKVVVNFPVEGDYGHRVLSRHQARVLRTQLRRVRRRRRECAQSAICSQAGGWLDEDHYRGRSTAPVAVRRRQEVITGEVVAPTLRHRTPPKRGAGVGSVQVADGR